MPAGRPLKFQSVKELEEKINAYFTERDVQCRPYIITGLALYLDVDRHTLTNYEEKDEFFTTIKRAKERILESKEEMLLRSTGQVAGVIFDLKNNSKEYYRDDSNLNVNADLSGNMVINLNPIKPKDE